MADTQNLVNDFVRKLQRRKLEGSHATALLTAEVLRSVISQLKVPQTSRAAAALIEAVKNVGKQLIEANPTELAVGNIVRRVLHIIREEELSLVSEAVEGLRLSAGDDNKDAAVQERCQIPFAARSLASAPSLCSLLRHLLDSAIACHSSATTDDSEGTADKTARTRKLKREVIKAVNELIEDIDTCHEQIAEQAVEHIHQNEVILTFGRSRTVEKFLRAAKEKRRLFQVFVAEGAPRYQGHLLAKELVERGLQTTLITDSAVFAMISRVNMVVVGVHAVMADGGVMGPVGLHMVALAAKNHAVPFVVVAGTHKLCPLYPQNPEVLLNEMRSPYELLNFGDFSDHMDYGNGGGTPLIHVVNPTVDYVPPELVSLLITDIGGYNPSFIYRLNADYYSTDDLVLQKKT